MKNGLKVTMFGSFALRIGDIVLDGSVLRSSQLEKLLAYLIIYRNKKIALQEFVDVLWEDGVDNPSGALKNLVYRLRNVLKRRKFRRNLLLRQAREVIHGRPIWRLN